MGSKVLNSVFVILKTTRYYLRLWLMMSKNSFLSVLSQKSVFTIFLFGKILRFSFFTIFLYYVVKGAETLAGFTFAEALFFFLTFMALDTVSQFLYREVYRFRPLIISGDFDLILMKPANSLFRVLLGGSDAIDLFTIPPLLVGLIYTGWQLSPSFLQVVAYIFLMLNGLLIATAFHVLVVSLGIITLEIDHSVMIYRDITSMGRFPVDIYKEPLRSILTFIIPVGIMVTLPAKVLMGAISISGSLLLFVFGLGFFYLSLRIWKYALRQYTSASS